jgi:MFS family permease
LSAAVIRETAPFAHLEASNHPPDSAADGLTKSQVFVETSFREPSLSSASQAGLVNNLNDGMAWGLLPLFFASAGLSITQIAILAALYPAVWGVGQLFTGAWSDRIGRKPLIVTGMWLQAGAIAVIPLMGGVTGWAVAMVLLGVGTALVYPTLLAAIGDVAHPSWRASAVGVYRLWRDLGFAVGALLTGVIADLAGVPTAIWTVAVITALSGTVVQVRMRETLRT